LEADIRSDVDDYRDFLLNSAELFSCDIIALRRHVTKMKIVLSNLIRSPI